MLTFKRISLLLLALLLALTLVACGGGEPAESVEPDPPIAEPGYEEEEDDGYLTPVPPIGEIPDSEFEDADWSVYPVIIDGVGVPGSSFEMIGDDAIFPTHVSLMAIERALGVDIFWNLQTDEVFFPGLKGNIHFFVGTTEFAVDGETIILDQESLRMGEEIYVPIQFFRDVFGASSAYFSGGNVFINTEGGDMH